ncbi:hypothetical protein WSK_3131 [Novosphingobium sp. Rr 2-17]|uniref:hypothetical protein n=1 Tax=Novosphingobium sp. Rr 2-17 TaxID=555793 RepID=UPI0002698228|nr:hypothetical protein [Novosphingobium sp. Rr 2-17]EIZ78249.1 hypothetical protein WSK_3131 [Novosphingobium sp. Rr 2-17]
MSKINGTNLAAPIAPFDTLDSYPTHSAEFGKGGWRTVATIAARNALPSARLEPGCVVYVEADKTPYLLQNGAWVEFIALETAVRLATGLIDLQAAFVGLRNEVNGN